MGRTGWLAWVPTLALVGLVAVGFPADASSKRVPTAETKASAHAVQRAKEQVKQLNDWLDQGDYTQVIAKAPAMAEQAEASLGETEPWVWELWNLLAIAHSEYGLLEDSLRLKEKIFQLREAHAGVRDPSTQVAALNLVTAYTYLDRYDEGMKLLSKVESWPSARADKRVREYIRLTLFNVKTALLGGMGDWVSALAAAEQGVAWGKTKKVDAGRLSLYRALSVALAEASTPDQALGVATMALDLYEKARGPQNPETAHMRLHLARVQFSAGLLREAEDSLDRGLADLSGVLLPSNRHVIAARSLRFQSHWLRQASPTTLTEMADFRKHAAQHAAVSGFSMRRLSTFLGQAHLEQGHLDEARRLFQEEEQRYGAGSFQYTRERLRALMGLAAVHRSRQEFDEAQARLKQAAALVRRQSTLVAATLGKAAQTEFWDAASNVYGQCIDLALDLGDTHGAYRWLMEAQDSPTAQALKLKGLERAPGADKVAWGQWRKAVHRAAMLDVRIARKYESDQRLSWESERRRLEVDIEELGARLRSQAEAADAGASEGGGDLGHQSLTFFPLTEGRLAVFWADGNGGIKVWRTGSQHHLWLSVGVLRSALAGSAGNVWEVDVGNERFWMPATANAEVCSEAQWTQYQQSLDRLKQWPGVLPIPTMPTCQPPGAQKIVSKAAADRVAQHLATTLLPEEWSRATDSIGRLNVVPVGALWHLPWDVLTPNEQPLVMRADVAVVPSLAMVRPLAERAAAMKAAWREDAPGRLLALAPQATLAGGAEAAKERTDTALMRWHQARTGLGLSWKTAGSKPLALPYSGQEVDAVRKVWGNSLARTLKGRDAAEKTVRQWSSSGVLSNFRWLWVASHGLHDEHWPALSAVLLSSSGQGDGRDGIISAAEWPELNLDARLVVLSACETALGQPRVSGGIEGLPSAVLLSGAVGTTQSLWRVGDKATATMMKDYAQRLRQGVEPVEALAATKRQMLKSTAPQLRSPSAWAAFQHYGL